MDKPAQRKFLRRKEAAEVLTTMGVPVKPATLARKACVGGGPRYKLFGRIPLYEEPDLAVWVAEQLSEPAASSAEIDVARTQSTSKR